MNNNPYPEKQKRPVSASAVVRIVIWSLVLCILLGFFAPAMVFGFTDLALGVSIGGYSYDNADSYRVGNGTCTDEITALDIDWISGNVEIVPAEGDTVTVTESYNGDEDDLRMRWKVENGRLIVKHRAPYWLIGVNQSVSKSLTVAVPSSMLEALRELQVSTVSGDLTVQANADEVDIETVSGKVTVKGTFGTLDVETVSGDVTVEGTVGEADFDGVSAKIKLFLAEAATSVDVNTVSGDVTVVLPADMSGFTADMESVSGSIEVRGFENVSYGEKLRIWGDGSMRIHMDGVSAKLIIEKETSG